MATAKIEAGHLEAKYDKYDFSNVKDAKLFVCNFLTKELSKELHQVTKDTSTFINFWMMLMDIVHIASTDHFEDVKQTMRNRKSVGFVPWMILFFCVVWKRNPFQTPHPDDRLQHDVEVSKQDWKQLSPARQNLCESTREESLSVKRMRTF